jgi:XTP/dITP diphosphohydrolase
MSSTKLKYSSLAFVSNSQNKHREYCAILGIADMRWIKVKIHEPQHLNLQLLVEEKLNILIEQRHEPPFFVEHTGLIIEEWKGLPGGLTAVFMNTVGSAGICKMMRAYKGHERAARGIVVIGFYHPKTGIHTFPGEAPGTIAAEPRGSAGFGWDAIFVPDGDERTYAEMSLAEKNITSMRNDAVRKFRRFLGRHFEL